MLLIKRQKSILTVFIHLYLGRGAGRIETWGLPPLLVRWNRTTLFCSCSFYPLNLPTVNERGYCAGGREGLHF